MTRIWGVVEISENMSRHHMLMLFLPEAQILSLITCNLIYMMMYITTFMA